MKPSPLAGKPAELDILTDIPKLVSAYYTDVPDYDIAAQRVVFGTSGHRGSSFDRSFNEAHVLVITQAICLYRQSHGIDGPLFLGLDTHALSVPAYSTVLEVLAANEVEVMISLGDEFTPTPVISHAILGYNRGRKSGLADGIILTPSHNPPRDGGFKYNPCHGGAAEKGVTDWIENQANELLAANWRGVKRMPWDKALAASTTHRHDYLSAYIEDLKNVIDMESIRSSRLHLGVDPLGGAGVHYWGRIAELYKLNLTVVSTVVDPTFRFMSVDWDGQIRMDPSSPYAMQRLIGLRSRFDLAFACDTDHDRHGIVSKTSGLMPPNHYLCCCIDYLLRNRLQWSQKVAIGKTVVSTQMIDRIAAKFGQKIFEVPVGFKWFVSGLLHCSLSFAGEESAGATFSRLDGRVWTTDKDGFVPALLSAEMMAQGGRDPGELYQQLVHEFGEPVDDRLEAAATEKQKSLLRNLRPRQFKPTQLAGEKIQAVLTQAPGNGASIEGLKVVATTGWFAARPSGTEKIYKIYAESFRGRNQLKKILEEAQKMVNDVLELPSEGAADDLGGERLPVDRQKKVPAGSEL